MASPPPTDEWSFDANNRLYHTHSLTAEQRDASTQLPALQLTSNFSLDYPRVCSALNIQIHPLLLSHIQAWQPPRPTTPAVTSAPVVCSLPLPDSTATAASASILSPPVSARKATASPRPAAVPASKAGKKPEVKTPAARSGKKEEAAATAERKEDEVKKEEVPADERDTLALTHTSVDDGTVAALAIALAANRHIRCLRLQFCTLTDTAVRMLPAIVSKSCVQKLYLDRIALTESTDGSAPHPLLAVIPALASSNVQLLSLSGNGLSDADGAAIASALTANAMLVALTLSHNHLASSTAAALPAALLLNTTLAYLNVSHNPLTSPHLLALLAPLTTAPVEAPVKGASAAKGAQPPPPYRVQLAKETKTSYREANGTLRQLWCSGCAVAGAEALERVRQVVAASRQSVAAGGIVGAEGAGAAVGTCNGLERLGLDGNDWDVDELAELRAMEPVVSVEAERVVKHLRPGDAAFLGSTTPADAVAGQASVAAA